MIDKRTAKEQLAGESVMVTSMVKNKLTTKHIQIPEWLFDLATHTDEWIFENWKALDGEKHMEDLSRALFTGLLIDLRAKNR